MLRSTGAVLLVGVLAGVTVGGGVGVFAASSNKSVTVCVDRKDNHMNYSKDSKCKSHQFKVVLSRAGVAGAKSDIAETAGAAVGAKGDTGAAGAKGDTGDTGAAGAKGDTGAAGEKGDTGDTGAKGDTGDTGAAGAKGDTGDTGAKGDTGDTGANGTNGTNGVDATLAITQQLVCDGSDDGVVADEVCKIGMTGPGGGLIFFVDYNDQYSGFDYLEAAPSSCEGTSKRWSSDTSRSLAAVSGWSARAVGGGQANTTAMLTSSGSYVADTSGAAFYSDSLTCGGKSDWFLGSLGEMRLMYNNLQGVGGFSTSSNSYYWSSTEYDPSYGWQQHFLMGTQLANPKTAAVFVRPVRSF